jgi:ribosomal protein S18 acetylase RimI-like enzyme
MIEIHIENLKVIIRKMRREDLPGLEWEGELVHFRNIFRQVFDQYQDGEAVLWVAEFPPEGIIAQVFIQLNSRRRELANGNNRAYLFGFRVRPDFQNLGIGTRMLAAAEEDLIRRGYHSITLNVSRDNPDAQRLYERHGYRQVGLEPGRWFYTDHNGRRVEVNEPAYRMEKRLRPKNAPNQAI